MQPLDPAPTYDKYKLDPSKENLSMVVGALRPTINYALMSVNSKNDPVLNAEARVLAADAVKSFDPQYGVGIKTHVTNSLKKLSRVARKHRSPVNLPERHQIDSYTLDKARKEFEENIGRDPTMIELADKTGLPIKRIQKLNARQFNIIADDTLDGDEGFSESADYTTDALDYVYHDSDYLDQKILEYKMGYNGTDTLDALQIAEKLKVHPSQVSRRSAKLLIKVNETLDMLNKTDTDL